MKKLIITVVVFISLITPAYADNPSILDYINPNTVPQQPNNPNAFFVFSPFTSLSYFVTQAVEFLIYLAGLVTFGYVLWAGYRLLLAQGNAKTLNQARDQLLQAIIGFVIVFASYWIIQALEIVLGVKILS